MAWVKKILRLPTFFPDATYSTIHSVPLHNIYNLPFINGIVVTTLHFKLLDILDRLKKFGGIKNFIKLQEKTVVLSDSGGFQILSLVHNKKLGKITEQGAVFNFNGQKYLLTPEESQKIQHIINSDIRVVLDYPIMGDESKELAKYSVDMTTKWAYRAKKEFLSLLNITEEEFKLTSPKIKKDEHGKYIEISRPLLFAVVQGGNYFDLRIKSAQQLIEIGFDGFGFGGWPLDSTGKFNIELVKLFAQLVPKDKIAYGMGIGTPDDIIDSYKTGLTLFDCVLPTRNARHGLIYVHKNIGEPKGRYFDVLHIKNSKYKEDDRPLDPECPCIVCKNYTRSYINFLLKKKNPVGYYLASLHNIHFFNNIIESLHKTDEAKAEYNTSRS